MEAWDSEHGPPALRQRNPSGVTSASTAPFSLPSSGNPRLQQVNLAQVQQFK